MQKRPGSGPEALLSFLATMCLGSAHSNPTPPRIRQYYLPLEGLMCNISIGSDTGNFVQSGGRQSLRDRKVSFPHAYRGRAI